MKTLSLFCVSLSWLVGCTQEPTSKQASISKSNAEVIPCEGSTVSFSIEKNLALPKEVSPLYTANSPKYKAIAPNDDFNVFAFVCTSDFASFTLRDLSFVENGVFGRFLVGEGDRVEGLAEAIFGNDVSKLRIELHHPALPHGESSIFEHYSLRGWNEGGITYTSAGSAVLNDGKELVPYIQDKLMVGAFIQKDLPEANGCFPGETFQQSKFRIATASFTTSYCNHLTSDRSMAFRLLSLTVTDSSENLPVELRNKTVVVPPSDLAKVYTWGHHNVNDSFSLKLDHATYTAKTAAPFPGMQTQANFIIKYKTKEIVKGGPFPVSCGGVLTCELGLLKE